jgi:hypothetical protein
MLISSSISVDVALHTADMLLKDFSTFKNQSMT